MFIRVKPSGPRRYLQVVENRREGRTTRQRVIATLGRLDAMQAAGNIDGLLRSLSRFADSCRIVEGHRAGRLRAGRVVRIGPALLFERLWRETGVAEALAEALDGRKFGFPVERAVFLTVLHRLFASGSDRAAEKWKEDYRIKGAEGLGLHQLYRAMAWLGEPLGEPSAFPLAPRCTKDRIEEALFARGRDLFTGLDLVFFDTTSIYFEGEGGETIGEYGHSKDHRPDLKQMVVGAALDGSGRPIASELWPGNAADASALLPLADRLAERFGVTKVCLVADRGMTSAATVEAIEARGWSYLLGARMRRVREVRDEVLARAGRFREVVPKGAGSKAPSPLKVKEVRVGAARYVVCLNEAQAEKDRHDREMILAALAEALKQGDKSLVGNKGYRRYLRAEGKRFTIDERKAQEEARYDGKWVLRTNISLDAAEVARKYKELWRVERAFRSMKSALATRPISHQCDETIRGHVFCSFLALLLMHELDRRLSAAGGDLEWEDVKRDLEALAEVEVFEGSARYWLRTELRGTAGKALSACGIGLPPTVRREGG